MSMIIVVLSPLKPEPFAKIGEFGKQIEKINRWFERCSNNAKCRLSAGAKRDLNGRFRILAEHVGSALAKIDEDAKWEK